MSGEQHITTFAALGRLLRAWLAGDESACNSIVGSNAFVRLEKAVKSAQAENEWFTEGNIRMSLSAVANELLDEVKLRSWLARYANFPATNSVERVGVIAAGNIPLVCFHDVFCVLLADKHVRLKPSSKDSVLIDEVARLLTQLNPKLGERLELIDSISPTSVNRLIATGSNNTARYLEYAYRGLPILLRKNRNSVAVLNGTETAAELSLLANDIFSYFGMGCRNVSKLYVPPAYNFSSFIEVAAEWKNTLGNHKKYRHSYCYEKALYLSLDEPFTDGNFFLISQSKAYASPLAVLYTDFYTSADELRAQLIMDAEQLQCVVSANNTVGSIYFGEAQQPGLNDYADGVDTMQWLLNQ